jgi:glycosyltransferase involved in cell wall biosynthesis
MIGSNQRVLLIHRFFFPDSPPYALILENMRQFLVSSGCLVDVLASQPSYKSADKHKKEKYISRLRDSSRVFRLPVFRLKNDGLNKWINFFWFPLASFFVVLLGRRYNVVTVSTAPPVILAFLVALAVRIRGGKLIYHCMDIHPEIGRVSGEFRGPLVFNLLKLMDKFICKTATKIIVLSSDMKSSLKTTRAVPAEKIEIINNYDLSSGETIVEPFFFGVETKRRVVFTGNLGRFQNLEIFILALKNKPRLKNLELYFVGEGSALLELQRISEGLEEVVKFVPHQSISVVRKIISEADFGIVSLEEEVIKYAYPSKTMTYLAEGTPILASVGNAAELSRFILTQKVGVVVKDPGIEEVYEIFKLVNDDKLKFDRGHIKRVFDKHFSKKEFERKLSRLIFDEMVNS